MKFRGPVSPLATTLRWLAAAGGSALLAASTGGPLQALPVAASSHAVKASAAAKANPGVNKGANPAASPGAPKAGAKPIVQRPRAKANIAPAAIVAAPNCVSAAGVTTCDLWARKGTVTLVGADAPVNIWGFAPTAVAPAQLPGPVLIATQGQNLTVILHNVDLPHSLSFDAPGIPHIPDTTGIGSAGTTSYTYPAAGLAPGSYLYEAGPTVDQARQVRMGLYGLLIVRPSNFATLMSAYGGTLGDTFSAESQAVISEIDPEFNNSADPLTAPTSEFHATLTLFNGRTFDPAAPGLSAIPVTNGQTILLHYVNAALMEHGMTVLNQRQHVLASDSHVFTNGNSLALPGAQDVATEWLNPGQVADSFVTVDPSITAPNQIPIFDSGLHFSNGSDLGLGGGLAYLDVVAGAAAVAGGPNTTVSVTANGSNPATSNFDGTQDLLVTGTFSPSASSGELFFDNIGAMGSGIAMSGANGCTVTSTTFSCLIPAATLTADLGGAGAVDGDHIVWAHGFDGANWGGASGDVLTFNVHGPVAFDLTIHVTPTRGDRFTDVANGAEVVGGLNTGQDVPNQDVVVLGSVADSLSDRNVYGAQWCLDSTTSCPIDGVHSDYAWITPLSANPPQGAAPVPAPCVPVPTPPLPPPTPWPAAAANPGGGSVVSVCGDIPQTTVAALAEGVHTVYMRGCEGLNAAGSSCTVWGAVWASSALVIDKTGPNVSTVTLSPNPNNGYQAGVGNTNFLDSLQVTAVMADPVVNGASSNIKYGEVFVGATGPDGTGAEMIPAGSQWDSPNKTAYAYIPLAVLTAYKDGLLTFYVHARDEAGNWGPYTTAVLTLDKTAPTYVAPTLASGATTAAPCVSGTPCFTIAASDPSVNSVNTNIVQAEWFIDAGAHLACDPANPGCVNPVVVLTADPGQGLGTQITIGGAPSTSVSLPLDVGTRASGIHIVYRVRDAAGNWSDNRLVITK